jgi:hypothetical protein
VLVVAEARQKDDEALALVRSVGELPNGAHWRRSGKDQTAADAKHWRGSEPLAKGQIQTHGRIVARRTTAEEHRVGPRIETGLAPAMGCASAILTLERRARLDRLALPCPRKNPYTALAKSGELSHEHAHVIRSWQKIEIGN